MREMLKSMGLICIVLLVFFLWLHSDGGLSPSLQEKNIQEPKQKENKPKQQKKKERKVHITRQDGSELTLSMNTYLEGVVASEMSASFEMEALKAQSVAARTFAIQRGYEVDDTTRTQVYHDDKQLRQIWGKSYDKYHKRIKEAVAATTDEIITYKGKAISAVFFSGSCGKTANSNEYWGGNTPYLRSVDSHWDKEEKGYEKTVFFSEGEFAKKLGFQKKVSEIERPKLYASGYVNTIKIDRINFRGRTVREKLGLRSSCFTIQKVKGGYHITTKGYGHGLGLSQYGAQGMAKEGILYKDILKHYYTGVTIEKKK